MPPKYENRTVKDLRELAKKRNITGYSSMRKGELIDSLRSKSSKYESCVLQVKKKQPTSCRKRNYKRSKSCSNPWAICNASIYDD